MTERQDSRLEQLTAARRKIEELAAQLPGAVQREHDELKGRLDAQLERNREAAQQQVDEIHHRLSWESTGRVNDFIFTSTGQVARMHLLTQWQNGADIVYVDTDASKSEAVDINVLRGFHTRVQAQKQAFEQLSLEEQQKQRETFGTGAKSEAFGAYLDQERLAIRFKELKENPPRPTFGK